ncbi:MAG TPA: hypothetical protein VG713_09145 [Pirellulales bacterium]|nr:hypothetical protein [Pirellulales bacterium]
MAPAIGFAGGVGFALLGFIKLVRKILAPAPTPPGDETVIRSTSRTDNSAPSALVPLEKTDQPEVRYPDGRIEHPWVRHEMRDVYAGRILAVLVVVTLLSSAHFYSFRRWFRDYEGLPPRHDQATYETRGSSALPRPPELEQIGRLEDDPRPNAFLRQQQAERALDRYASGDEPGFVQIPIARAIELLPDRVRSRTEPAPAAKSQGLVDAGEPNSGRLLQGAAP